jgi:hypothetical protein
MMSETKALLDAGGTLVNIIVVDADYTPPDGFTLGDPAKYPFPAPVTESLTRMEFLERLGQANWAKLKAAATQNVQIDFQMERARAADVILRSDALPFLQMIEGAGIIPPGTAAAVWA